MKIVRIVIIGLVLFSSINSIAQKKNSKLTKSEVKSGLIEGFAKFVESVRPFYDKGDTYIQFKLKVLIGNTNTQRSILPTLPAEGERMLLKAYNYLASGTTYNQIVKRGDFRTLGEAVLFLDSSVKRGKSISEAEVALFGGNLNELENNPLGSMNRGGCRWYQIGCHLNSIFGEGGGGMILDALIVLIIDLLT